EKAKKVIENEDAVESEVNDAYNKLVKVYLELRLIVDKTKLQELINEAEAIDVSKYTEVSIAILNEKVQELKSILNDKEATQEVVNEASKALEKVLDNLELVKADDNETTSTPGDTETKPATPKPTVPPTSNAIDLANSTITIAGNNKVKEDKASKLPNTGGTSAIGVILSALMITGAGVFLRRKK
ncbi:MAG: LPXTG cell wall anchor domain-containing protein, partial [Bacilli bacterium]